MDRVLFFELFPAFIAIVSVLVGIILFVADRRARRDPPEREPRRPPRQPDGARPYAPERPGRRPSMAP